ncbi:MAG TPA: hypothetical protein VND41_03295 [Nitrososphaerales archaeon]|nr:hypothetical protein [Nitrososphaerales archaeon]
MRRAIPIAIGVMLLLVGIGWASQGAGIIGGSSLMDNNPTFIFLGGILAVLGIATVAYGVVMKTRAQAPSSITSA